MKRRRFSLSPNCGIFWIFREFIQDGGKTCWKRRPPPAGHRKNGGRGRIGSHFRRSNKNCVLVQRFHRPGMRCRRLGGSMPCAKFMQASGSPWKSLCTPHATLGFGLTKQEERPRLVEVFLCPGSEIMPVEICSGLGDCSSWRKVGGRFLMFSCAIPVSRNPSRWRGEELRATREGGRLPKLRHLSRPGNKLRSLCAHTQHRGSTDRSRPSPAQFHWGNGGG